MNVRRKFFGFDSHTNLVTTIHLCSYNIQAAIDHKLVTFCCDKAVWFKATSGRISFCSWLQKQSHSSREAWEQAASTGGWEITSQLHITGRESKVGDIDVNMAGNLWCPFCNRNTEASWNSSINRGPIIQTLSLWGSFLFKLLQTFMWKK